jgi:hypothetical protein
MARPRIHPIKETKAVVVNVHSTPVHLGDGRKVQPGDAIPDDVTDDIRGTLMATGFFK